QITRILYARVTVQDAGQQQARGREVVVGRSAAGCRGSVSDVRIFCPTQIWIHRARAESSSRRARASRSETLAQVPSYEPEEDLEEARRLFTPAGAMRPNRSRLLGH